MSITAGTLLISSPSLNDPNFDKVIIFITENNDKGAIGFVINKLFPRTFNELIEFKSSKVFALYKGGPMGNENLYFIHRRPDLIKDSIPINDNIFFGGNLQQVATHINNAFIQKDEIKIFIGYCGWDTGELEAEVEEGSWLISPSTDETIFSQNTYMLWEILYNGLV